MTRISRDNLYTNIAKEFAKRSTCGRLQVGCVITRDGRIIGTGYNGPLKGPYSISSTICSCDREQPCNKSIHAESNAIAFAARNGISLEDTVMYITHSPCLKCSELIIQAGIKEVIYIEEFRDHSGLWLLRENGLTIMRYEEHN